MVELAKKFPPCSMRLMHTLIARAVLAPLWASLMARAIERRVPTANGLPGDGAELH